MNTCCRISDLSDFKNDGKLEVNDVFVSMLVYSTLQCSSARQYINIMTLCRPIWIHLY